MAYEQFEYTIDTSKKPKADAAPEIDLDAPLDLDDESLPGIDGENLGDDDDLDLDVVDDRAPDDRGKKNAHQVNDDDFDEGELADPGDDPDERAKYVEASKKRLRESTFRFHAERRSREDAERQAAAAFQLAKSYMQQLQNMQKTFKDSEKVAVEAWAAEAQQNVSLLTKQLEKAHLDADPAEIVKAQAALNDAQMRLAQLRSYRPVALNEPNLERDVAQYAPPVQAPEVDNATRKWAKANPWFDTEPAMRQHAMNVHNQLEVRGVNPLTDERTYFTTIDKEMRRRFPDYPWLDSPRASTPPVVTAPAARSTPKRKQKITLTRSQVQTAKNLGLTVEQYAREVAKLKSGG